jgi:transposase
MKCPSLVRPEQRYHSISPCLAGISTPAEQAQALNVGYSTVTRWLRKFREQGMPGLFPETQYPREPYTPERVIVQLIFFKCCAPKAGDRELARVIHHLTSHRIDHHTVKALCERFFFWRHPEFQQLVRYPVPADPQALRLEVVRLSQQGWTETRTAELLHKKM